ncbi:MAG: ribosome silencing factor [Proteobacteria bacterium]|nr:ribosome silencing factor [Pseudomonadota bacterium]
MLTARRALEDKKAEDIAVISLKGKSAMADALIIATGTSDRHVNTLIDNVRAELEKQGSVVHSVEGTASGHWVLLDAGSVVVHVFQPEARQLYRLERLWSPTFWDDDEQVDSKADLGIL